MVKKVEIKGKKYYQCESCGFYYEDRAWAEKCQAFCEEHKSCSTEITGHSVKVEGNE